MAAWHIRWRWWITTLCCYFLSISQISCHSSADRAHLYSDARQRLERGDLDSALSEADRGFRDSANSDPIWNWKFRVLKAESLLWQTRNQEVLDLLATSPPQELSSGEFAVRAKAAEGMALVHSRTDADDQGRFKEAEELAIRTAPHLRCEIALFRGNQLLKKGQFASEESLKEEQYKIAEGHFRQSLQLAREHQQPFIELGALMGLGIVTTRVGRFDEAIEWSLRSLDFARLHQWPLGEDASISNLVYSYRELGDLVKAIKFAEELKVESLGHAQIKETVLSNLGEIYAAQRKYSAAREAYLKAVDIASEMERHKRSDERHRMMQALSNLARVSLAENKIKEAQEFRRRASELDPKAPSVLLITAEIAATLNKLDEAESLLQNLIRANSAEKFARWEAQSELAKIHFAQHQNRLADQEFQDLLAAVEKAHSNLRVDENKLAFSFHAKRFYDEYVRFLVETSQQRRAFQQTELRRARILAEGVGLKAPLRPEDIHIESILSFLKQHHEVVLAYWLAPNVSYLWMITPSQFQFFSLPGQEEIDEKVARYQKTITSLGDVEHGDVDGQDLYRILIGPVRKLIPGGCRIVIIPDGSLSTLNFETLLVPEPPVHFWLNDVEVEDASSVGLLMKSGPSHARNRKLLVIGDPVQATTEYERLAYAPQEIEAANHFPATQKKIISGPSATPSSYAANSPEQYDVIHFATHGFASEVSPLDSAIILSPGADGSFKLYARDIVNTHLSAEVVTISACYGAGKRVYSGEGLVGLAWAFLKAGAHQVIAGLWNVEDQSTPELMRNFYTELGQGKSAARALRNAKLKMLHSNDIFRLPYYWGALQLYSGS